MAGASDWRAVPSLLCLRGELVVVGKSPDGDSIRFRPRQPELIRGLVNGDRARPSSDGTFQLRLDGIDTPETHYNGLAQPLGAAARDELLAWVGFSDLRWAGGEVSASTPASIPAAILTGLVDVNGRPVAFLAVGGGLPDDGVQAEVELSATANAALLRSGAAYGTFYASTAPELRDAMRGLAREARTAGLGVWPDDASRGFTLSSQASIGPEGSLILPKLFRRCTDYLRSRNSRETLSEWMGRMGDQQDDEVSVGGAAPVRFRTLISQAGDKIALDADPLDLVFDEK
jgi:endonuclease YncB( thermonuclease family)